MRVRRKFEIPLRADVTVSSSEPSLEVAYTHAVEAFKFVIDLMFKAWALVAVLSGALITVSFTAHAAFGLLVAGLVTTVSGFAPIVASRVLVPVAYFARNAESRSFGMDGLASLAIANVSHTLSSEFDKIAGLEDPSARRAALQRLSVRRPIGLLLSTAVVLGGVLLLSTGVYALDEGWPLLPVSDLDITDAVPQPTIPD